MGNTDRHTALQFDQSSTCTRMNDLGTVFTMVNYQCYQGLANYERDTLEQTLEHSGNTIGVKSKLLFRMAVPTMYCYWRFDLSDHQREDDPKTHRRPQRTFSRTTDNHDSMSS